MSAEKVVDAFPINNDEDWLVSRAKQCLKTDPYAAKAWLLTARSLFPKSFKIQLELYLQVKNAHLKRILYEAYTIEKNAKNSKEVSKILENMFRNFPQEPLLWQEVKLYSDMLQSEATDEKTVFLKKVFAAFPVTLQYHMLVNVAEITQDILQKCRLMLLILDRYPEQVPDQGVKLIDSLLSTEKHHQPASPVNCYRKYLVCHVIPQVLKSNPQVSSKHLYRWLQKAIEFYLCYITQQPTDQQQQSADLMSPTSQRAYSGSGSHKVLILGLSEKESHIDRPWSQLFSLLDTIGRLLDWDVAGLFDDTSCGSQWERLQSLWKQVSDQTESTSETKQVLYCATVLFLSCLYKYACHIDPSQFTVPAPSSTTSAPVLLVQALTLDSNSMAEHKSKKLKKESSLPEIVASTNLSNATELIDTFLTAFRCYELLHSTDILSKDFLKLLQHWKSESWSWLSDFEIDVLLYQGHFKEALTKLQNPTVKSSSEAITTRSELQIACCQYCMGNFTQACERVMRVVNCLPTSTDPPTSLPVVPTGSRHMQLLVCRESEVLPYCIELLITCFKEKAFGTSMPDDMSLGHMIVLMQYDWSKYEQLFCDIINRIRHQGNFTYNLFFNYVINIDILEEFAYLNTEGGGKVNLDILSTSTKQITQTRTVTRGVNKGVKEDYRAALEKQVARSEENLETIIRHFFAEERDLLKQHLT